MIPALEAAERFGTEHGADIAAREALAALIAGALGPDEGAGQMASLFAAIAELLTLDGARHISPDAAREYAAIARKMRGALVHHAKSSSTAQKRARVYLEERIIRQAEKCGRTPSSGALTAAVEDVLALTAGDVWSAWLPLARHSDGLRACIRAAAALPIHGGQFVSPGARRTLEGRRREGTHTRAQHFKPRQEAYEKAFRALCQATGLPCVEKNTRASARSRAKRRDR